MVAIYESEGKRYIEFNKVLIVIITAIIGLTIALSVFVWFLMHQSNKIYSDPLVYGAQIYQVDMCSCVTKNSTFNFDQNKVWMTQKVQQQKMGVFDPSLPPNFSNIWDNKKS